MLTRKLLNRSLIILLLLITVALGILLVRQIQLAAKYNSISESYLHVLEEPMTINKINRNRTSDFELTEKMAAQIADNYFLALYGDEFMSKTEAVTYLPNQNHYIVVFRVPTIPALDEVYDIVFARKSCRIIY